MDDVEENLSAGSGRYDESTLDFAVGILREARVDHQERMRQQVVGGALLGFTPPMRHSPAGSCGTASNTSDEPEGSSAGRSEEGQGRGKWSIGGSVWANKRTLKEDAPLDLPLKRDQNSPDGAYHTPTTSEL